MTKPYLIVSPEERARPLNIAGFSITVLASGAQTGGYEIFHQIGPEGTGPGPHSTRPTCCQARPSGCEQQGLTVETPAGLFGHIKSMQPTVNALAGLSFRRQVTEWSY